MMAIEKKPAQGPLDETDTTEAAALGNGDTRTPASAAGNGDTRRTTDALGNGDTR